MRKRHFQQILSSNSDDIRACFDHNKKCGAAPEYHRAAMAEPILIYERILNNLETIIERDTITSSCLHSKLFVIGTQSGKIHVLDHLGNKVDRKELCFHYRPVTSISIDEKGEYIVSCSSNRLAVYGLCNNDHDSVIIPDKPANLVAIDPYFHRAGRGRRFVVGDDKVTLYERGFLGKHKLTVLQNKEQDVKTLSWHGQFIAWATDFAVQIFDVEQRAIITRIKRDTEMHQCHFCWRDNRTLLIGWSNTVKVCLIKERSQEVLNETQLKELPKKYVEIVSMFETDFIICGLAPFNTVNLLVLALPERTAPERRLSQDSEPGSRSISPSGDPDTSDGQMVRPHVYVLEISSNDYSELSKDVLTPNQCPIYPIYESQPYSLVSLHSEGLFFIVCPKDVIVAKPRDFDDHIDWLIENSMYKECFSFAKENSKELVRHSLKEVQEIYMKYLLDKETSESYSEAAQLCSSLCGTDQKAWREAVENFCSLGELKHLIPCLPKKVDGFHLDKQTYDHIFEELLEKDPMRFLIAIKEIPSKLYDLQSIYERTVSHLNGDPKNLVLNEALAEMYTRMGKFEEAVNIYLDCNDKSKIFSLIRTNGLVSILRDRVDRLMQMDADETSQLLIENIEMIPPKDIISKLERDKSKLYLLSYLHRMVLKDPDSCIEYHDLMVRLYAQHQKGSLMNFLKLSTNYRLEEALSVCQEANLIKEVVYLYGRMGDLRIALKYITESQGIGEAVEFCKEHQDPELWQDLIAYSMDKPEYVGVLLKNIGTHINDPIGLIDRIPVGCEIEGLMPALVKILQDYQLQISLEQSCRDLMSKDCFSLLEKQIRCQTQGITVKEDQLCDHCNQPLLNDSMIDQSRSPLGVQVGQESSNSVSPASGDSRLNQSTSGGTSLNDLVVFGCHHVFHEECCANASPTNTLDSDELSNKLLTCRVCMLEKDYDNQV